MIHSFTDPQVAIHVWLAVAFFAYVLGQALGTAAFTRLARHIDRRVTK